MNELKLIHTLLAGIEKSPLHQNKFFECDAELIDFNNQKILFSTDEFSAEDFFRDVCPYTLGWNLVAATISDVYASGGIPRFFAQALVYPQNWSEDFVKNLARGINDALKESGTNFMGGDIGKSHQWHFTGIVLGEPITNLSRIGAAPGHVIYSTGYAGAGNIDAAISIFSQLPMVTELAKNIKNKFPIRHKEAGYIRQYASSCIDTSDGYINAVRTVADLNGTGFSLQLPLIPELFSDVCTQLHVPAEVLLFGECGEYELLFTVPENKVAEFDSIVQSKYLNIQKIGSITTAETRVLNVGSKLLNLLHYNLSARDFNSFHDYLNRLINFL